jgi:multidrug efflux pump subunit AcrA (membrane-fusion protein)
VERSGGPPLDAADVQGLEHLACLAAPVLALMLAGQRPWHRRAADALEDWASGHGAVRRRVLRRAALGVAAAALLLLLWPVGQPVGGRARLEGAVQRVLAAPADGFVAQVHARPGDVVRAGAPLVDLADQELQLERQRWQSQLAQHLDAYAAAQARADRSLLVQHQSKADEAQAQLDLVDEKLARSRLVAPFDAVVVQGDLSQQLGAPVKQGAELMTLAPGGQFRVIVEIDERDVALVRVGQTGTLALTSLPWDTLPLRVGRITPMATPVEGRNVFEVEAALLAPAPGLRPGLQGSAQIGVGQAPTLWRWSRRVVESLRLTAWEWFG